MKDNLLEKVSHKLGRIIGSYQSGLKAAGDAPLSAPSAWVHPTLWGEALLKGRKPQTADEYLRYFSGWAYVAADRTAQSIASSPYALYVRKKSKSQKFKTIETKPISKVKAKWLYSNKGLIPYLKKAEEVEEVVEHPVLDLLQNVNKFATSIWLWKLTSLFLDLTGDAYWYPSKDRMNVPRELWVIPSQYITPIPGKTYGEQFVEGYEYKVGSQKVTLGVDELIRFSYPNPKNQFKGFSCIQGIADAIYIYSKMNEFEEALFANKARVGGVLEASEGISQAEMERLRTEWKQKYAGAAKSGSTVILPPGLKFNKDTMTPEELSFIEGRKLTREEITAGLDVPFALFDVKAIRANVEQAEYNHAKHGVMPRLRLIEEVINEKLLGEMYPNETGDIFLAFENIVPEDKDFMLEKTDKYVKSNIITINEVREEEGRESVSWGDTAWIDSRLIPVGDEGSEEEQANRLARRAKEKMKEILGN